MVGTGQGTIAVAANATTGKLDGTVVVPPTGYCRPLLAGETIWRDITYDPTRHIYTGTATYPRRSLNCQVGAVQSTWKIAGAGVFDTSTRKPHFSLSWTAPSTGDVLPAPGNETVTELERSMSAAELAAPWHTGRWLGPLKTAAGATAGTLQFGIGDIAGPHDIAWLRATLKLDCRTYAKATGWGPAKPAGPFTIQLGKSRGLKAATISTHAAEDDGYFGWFAARGTVNGTAAQLRGAGGVQGSLRITATLDFWGWLNGHTTGDLSGLSTLAHSFSYAETLTAGAKALPGQRLCSTTKPLDWTVAWDRSGSPYSPVR
jgi:hypothetical protein